MGRLGAVFGRPWGVLELLLVAIERTSKIIEKLTVFIGFFKFGAVWEGILWRSWGVLDGLETS